MTEDRPLVRFLKIICQDNLTEKKNLIMSSYLDGNTFKKVYPEKVFLL